MHCTVGVQDYSQLLWSYDLLIYSILDEPIQLTVYTGLPKVPW